MDQRVFIIILIIFLLTNNFSQIIKDALRGLVYLLLLIALLKIINPSIEKKAKENLTNIINLDYGVFTNSFSIGASYIKNVIKTSISNKDIVNLLNNYIIPKKEMSQQQEVTGM